MEKAKLYGKETDQWLPETRGWVCRDLRQRSTRKFMRGVGDGLVLYLDGGVYTAICV